MRYIYTALIMAGLFVAAFDLTMLGAYLIMAFVEWGWPAFDWQAFRTSVAVVWLIGSGMGLLAEFIRGPR